MHLQQQQEARAVKAGEQARNSCSPGLREADLGRRWDSTLVGGVGQEGKHSLLQKKKKKKKSTYNPTKDVSSDRGVKTPVAWDFYLLSSTPGRNRKMKRYQGNAWKLASDLTELNTQHKIHASIAPQGEQGQSCSVCLKHFRTCCTQRKRNRKHFRSNPTAVWIPSANPHLGLSSSTVVIAVLHVGGESVRAVYAEGAKQVRRGARRGPEEARSIPENLL